MEIVYIILIIVVLLVFISIIYSHFKIDISFYNIKNKKIDKSIKMIFLSDLHNRDITDKLIKIINDEKPDIVIYGGDMINEDLKEINNFINLVNKNNIKSYYVYGNHEESLSNESINSYTNIIKDKTILLNNIYNNISNNIVLYGLDSDIDCYLNFHKLGLNKEYINNKLGNIDLNKFNILVAHNPLEFDSYVKSGYDLVLSGHVHGGLFMVPIFGALLSPDYTFFPKYNSGKYQKDSTTMIVSRGLGYSKRLHFRINNPAEVVVININKE